MSLEDTLAKLAVSAITIAGQHAFATIASVAMGRLKTYAKQQPILARTPEHLKQLAELQQLQTRLETKLTILTPVCDLILLSVARGHNSLSTIANVTHTLRNEINAFGSRMATSTPVIGEGGTMHETERVMDDIRMLMDRMDDVVPLIQLAVTLSGVRYTTTTLQSTISLSLLLQASRGLREGVEAFSLRMYTLFKGSVRKSVKGMDFSWKEEFHRADGRLERVKGDEIAYRLVIQENLDDGLVHESDVPSCKVLGLMNIATMYFSSSGRLLRIPDSNSPVLILKVRQHRVESGDRTPPNGATGSTAEEEWIALELYQSSMVDTSSEGEEEEEDNVFLVKQDTPPPPPKTVAIVEQPGHALGLLEYMIRLAALEMRQQCDHSDIPDEQLALFLSNDMTPKQQEKTTHKPKHNVYSPIKRRQSARLTHK